MTTTEPAPAVTDHRLLHSSTETLMAEAAAIRDRAHGTRVTFSPKVFIPLTMLCRDKCGYCTFAQPPARLENPYLSAEQVLAICPANTLVKYWLAYIHAKQNKTFTRNY